MEPAATKRANARFPCSNHQLWALRSYMYATFGESRPGGGSLVGDAQLIGLHGADARLFACDIERA